MIAFTTSFAFVLSAVRELSDSVLPCAATHGATNGVAGLTLFLTTGANRLIGGIVGLVGIACFGFAGALLWLVVVPMRARSRRTASA